jgi:hypothetical protein
MSKGVSSAAVPVQVRETIGRALENDVHVGGRGETCDPLAPNG